MLLTNELSNRFRNMGILCSFFVVLIHCRQHLVPGDLGWWGEQIVYGVTEIAVPFFFLASGFFLRRSMLAGNSYWHQIKKRLLSLVVPFFFWCILFFLWESLLVWGYNVLHGVRTTSGAYSIATILKLLGVWYMGVPALTPLWYVRALFCLVVLTPFFLLLLKRFGVVYLFGCFVVYGAVCPWSPIPHWGELQSFARWGVFPVLGVFYFNLGLWLAGVENLKLTPRLAGVSLMLGLSCLVIKACLDIHEVQDSFWLGWISIPLNLYGFWGIMSTGAWPIWLTSCAFPIFLIHKFPLFVLKHIPFLKESFLTHLLVAGTAFFVSLFAALFIKRWFPKMARIVFGGRY